MLATRRFVVIVNVCTMPAVDCKVAPTILRRETGELNHHSTVSKMTVVTLLHVLRSGIAFTVDGGLHLGATRNARSSRMQASATYAIRRWRGT